MIASTNDSLALIVFKLFALDRQFTQYWPFAWVIEHQLDERGLSSDFRQRVEQRSGMPWSELREDPEFYLEDLYAIAAMMLPDNFREGAGSIERAISAIVQRGISASDLVSRLRRWCEVRDGGGHRRKLLLQLDELGQWMAKRYQRTERAQQIQALIETAAAAGAGRLWIAVTAHGDVQELRSSLQQEEYAKIIQRFAHKCKLSNEDINIVVQERLLCKTQTARSDLVRRFQERSGTMTDLGTIHGQRQYPPPDAESFASFYPYLPWTVHVIPDVVKGIAHAAGRDEALTGSNRTMIGVIQGAIIEIPGLLDEPVGRLLCLADLYDQLATDTPNETKTDLGKIRATVAEATDLTLRVARALYLLGEAEYIPTTLEHMSRALVDSIECDLSALQTQVRAELERLVAARYAKRVGDTYIFLNTQQRGFQDKVRDRQERIQRESYELIEAFKSYDNENALRFDKVPIANREKVFKLEIDGRVAYNSGEYPVLRVYSPFQHSFDPTLADDTAMKQRSQERNEAILIRLGAVSGLHSTLALAVATETVINEVVASATASENEKEIARQARQIDLPGHRADVRRLLGQAVRGAKVFYRGIAYDVVSGSSPSDAMRATLTDILPHMFPRISDVPHRLVNEDRAVRAALRNDTNDSDLQALGVYRADGTLNDAHALISTLRAKLAPDEQYEQFVQASALRAELERPPYGWDGNAVKVGLALLLRASACRLIDTSRTLSDPADPEVLQVLTKELRFRNLRVQGVRSDLTMEELRTIRGYMDVLWNERPALVQATLNSVLGEKLEQTYQQAERIQQWAATARCPLPAAFESGNVLVQELLNQTAPQTRLPYFLEQAQTLIDYQEQLQQLTTFQRDHGPDYMMLRDFYTGVVNAGHILPEVTQFIRDWRVLTQDRNITEPQRWNEIYRAYHASQHALDDQARSWRQNAQQQLDMLQAELDERVRAAGVPEDAQEAAVQELRSILNPLLERLAQQTADYYDVRGILTDTTVRSLQVDQRLAELREHFRPRPAEAHEIRLRLSDLGSARRLETREDVEALIATLQQRLLEEIAAQRIIVLE